jgi:hypothetical protein
MIRLKDSNKTSKGAQSWSSGSPARGMENFARTEIFKLLSHY